VFFQQLLAKVAAEAILFLQQAVMAVLAAVLAVVVAQQELAQQTKVLAVAQVLTAQAVVAVQEQ
jgi:hypothetical protein